jgi:predicted DNA binding protein
MPTMEEYAQQTRDQRLQRLTRTADELSAAIKGQAESVLARRPEAKFRFDVAHLTELTELQKRILAQAYDRAHPRAKRKPR